jgi:hypothetical protein
MPLFLIHSIAFAQEPFFASEEATEPGGNYELLRAAVNHKDVEAVGSAPYVEPSVAHSRKNINLIFDLAIRHKLHVDFHLDYNLDPNVQPLIYDVVSQARQFNAATHEVKKRITIGHATRLQLFSNEEWEHLLKEMKDLPLTFVSLPNSDIYMQGRGDIALPLGAPRGTLRVPYLFEKYGLDMAMSVNNVENAFTPQGSVDPLALCPLGVAIFQSATLAHLRTLLVRPSTVSASFCIDEQLNKKRSVTVTSKRAIGQTNVPSSFFPVQNDPADFVIVHEANTIQQVVLNPGYDRTTINAGKVVAKRVGSQMISALNQG